MSATYCLTIACLLGLFAFIQPLSLTYDDKLEYFLTYPDSIATVILELSSSYTNVSVTSGKLNCISPKFSIALYDNGNPNSESFEPVPCA